MYKIAVCDNDLAELDVVVQFVKQFFARHPSIHGELSAFSSTEELKERIQRRDLFDLYLLDILMPGLDGIGLGRLIREKTTDIPIVYITSSQKFAFEAYGVNALQYLTKPVERDKLWALLERTYQIFRLQPRHTLLLKSENGTASVVQEDIMYVENQMRTAVYTMYDGQQIHCARRSGSFESAVSDIAANEEFMQPHKSFFLNMKYIKVFGDTAITMDDETVIPVNQKRGPGAKKQYLEYLNKKVGWNGP